MADSNITKQALARALKELMQEKPFEKISISDICEKCDMNRKSFYYHFKDKYDLLNWIFDMEFIATVQTVMYEDSWTLVSALNNLFYKNRSFYRRALRIQGQNSFSEHFHEMLISVIAIRFQELTGIKGEHGFQVRFFADAFVMAYQRWIIEETDMTPEEFLKELKMCMEIILVQLKNI